jgi:hypothetical protein
MMYSSEIRLAPPVAAMNAFVEQHREWIETVIGCPWSESATFEMDVPFGQLVAEDLLKGVALDRQCLSGADAVRASTVRWELPPGLSPRIELIHSREQNSPITSKNYAWDPHWKETPVALWLKGLTQALVAAEIPYVSFANGMRSEWKTWLIANRKEIMPALNLLNRVLIERPKKVTVIGGTDIPLPRSHTDWDCLALDTRILELVKRDLEFFFQREAWFKRSLLHFRRGYLFYGPPGNGKTSVVRVMATQPAIRAFSLDFSNEWLHNDALTELFEAASHAAPSLVIFEDLDRLYGRESEGENKTKITLQHLLNCLDGLGNKDGTIVVATANNPENLDSAILRRPGRFDRVVPFLTPSPSLRREYLTKVTGRRLPTTVLDSAAALSDGFSFAQLRESYILAGQIAFQRNDEEILGEDLLEGVKRVRNSANGADGRLGERGTGFTPLTRAAQG